MTFGQFLSALRARWIIALTLLLLVVGSTAAVSQVRPKRKSAVPS
jgi:hypothetical protein